MHRYIISMHLHRCIDIRRVLHVYYVLPPRIFNPSCCYCCINYDFFSMHGQNRSGILLRRLKARENKAHSGYVPCASTRMTTNPRVPATIAQQLGTKPEVDPFATVLKSARVMVAVLTFVCDIYSRLW